VRDHKGGGTAVQRSDGKLRNDMLDWVAESWSTPMASDALKGGPNQKFGRGNEPLVAQAVNWATPRAEMARASGNPKHLTLRRGNGNLEDQTSAFSLPDRPISTDGEPSSHIRRTLNPLFVEWLMGWPSGWTSLALTPTMTGECASMTRASTGCACSATALSAWKRRMRSALSSLASPVAASPAQLDLLG
jgi:hypothetical protein